MVNLRVWLLTPLCLVAVLLAGCTGSSNNATNTANLPGAPALLATSAAATRDVRSVHFTLSINGNLANLPVRTAEGDLNSAGQAKGNAQITALGQLVQVDFVLVNNTFYMKGATGGYQHFPASFASNLFDPSAILDPNRGVAKVLASVQNPKTEAQEDTAGTPTYRISGKLSKDVVAALLPGLDSDVTTTLWVATDAKHLPVKAELLVPGSAGGQGATVDMTISNINAPVSVSAPS